MQVGRQSQFGRQAVSTFYFPLWTFFRSAPAAKSAIGAILRRSGPADGDDRVQKAEDRLTNINARMIIDLGSHGGGDATPTPPPPAL